MDGVTPIRDRMLFEPRTAALHITQWDGTKQQAMLLVGELERVLEEVGASLVTANYRARLSEGAPEVIVTIGRHDDNEDWRLNMRRGEWLVLWSDGARLVDAEVVPEYAGHARFRPVVRTVEVTES